jgi:DnaJ homolog subfamily C member 9
MGCDGAYYELLGVSPTASVAEIKRAFRQRALLVHPDRNPAADAVAAFRNLRRVHDVLTDNHAREEYDAVGETAGNDDRENADVGDAAFWARASASLTPDDIAAYEKQYPGSKDEDEDLIEHYCRFSGAVAGVVDYVPFAADTDLLRFLAVWDDMIADGRLEQREDYESARAALEKRGKKAQARGRKRKASGRAVAVSSKAAANSSGDDALAALIRGRASAREKSFDAWADSLADKYPAKKQSKAGSTRTGSKGGKGSKDTGNAPASATLAPMIKKSSKRR